MRNNKNVLRLAGAVGCLFVASTGTYQLSAQDKPGWQNHIDWSIGNHTTDPGETNCPDQYAATEPACITGGGRACLMARAIDSAKANNKAYAFRLTLITQCHNAKAQQEIAAAGSEAVGNYLKGK